MEPRFQFVARRSIQLSHGRFFGVTYIRLNSRGVCETKPNTRMDGLADLVRDIDAVLDLLLRHAFLNH